VEERKRERERERERGREEERKRGREEERKSERETSVDSSNTASATEEGAAGGEGCGPDRRQLPAHVVSAPPAEICIREVTLRRRERLRRLWREWLKRLFCPRGGRGT